MSLLDIYAARVGETYASDWFEIDQSRVDAFADVTLDHQFIHIDPERAAKETPFGGPIAHGFLTLSMLSHLAGQSLPPFPDGVIGINYGFDKVRFLSRSASAHGYAASSPSQMSASASRDRYS